MVDGAADTVGLLDGVRILDITRFPPGAYCTLLLADMGADVISVDPPPAVGRRAMGEGQAGLTRGKRSVTVDLARPEGIRVLRRLAESSDVLVENSRPGQMSERGFGFEHAQEQCPRLIWCSITGFGQDGPYAEWLGHDLTYTAHSGLLAALQPDLPWHPQAMLSVPIGGLMAAFGVVAALFGRGHDGVGCQLDISLADAATWMLSGDGSQFAASSAGIGVAPGRRLYECADERFVTVAAAEPRSWRSLCIGLGLSELVDGGPPSGAGAEAATDRIAEVFRSRPAAEWVDQLGPQGAAIGIVNRGADLAEDPHASRRASTVVVGGKRSPANPIRARDRTGQRAGTAVAPPPDPGANTDEVLSEAGYSEPEIDRLRSDGVV